MLKIVLSGFLAVLFTIPNAGLIEHVSIFNQITFLAGIGFILLMGFFGGMEWRNIQIKIQENEEC